MEHGELRTVTMTREERRMFGDFCDALVRWLRAEWEREEARWSGVTELVEYGVSWISWRDGVGSLTAVASRSLLYCAVETKFSLHDVLGGSWPDMARVLARQTVESLQGEVERRSRTSPCSDACTDAEHRPDIKEPDRG